MLLYDLYYLCSFTNCFEIFDSFWNSFSKKTYHNSSFFFSSNRNVKVYLKINHDTIIKQATERMNETLLDQHYEQELSSPTLQKMLYNQNAC